jgi:hypothetical protein
MPKILPHKFDLPEHDYSIWIDGNTSLKVPPEEIVEFFEYPKCGVFKHPWNRSIREEVEDCLELKLDEPEKINYHKDKTGVLAHCCFIIRKNDPTVQEYCEKWWEEIMRGSSRDQLSFPYTLGLISKIIDSESTKKRFLSRKPGHLKQRCQHKQPNQTNNLYK